LTFLANNKALVTLISKQDKSADFQTLKDNLISDWLLLAKTRGTYDQVRWLDLTGQEKIRVNYNAGQPTSISGEKLQNKGKRYYFADTVKLNRGEFFISPLDLNMEHGEIEQPQKPMLRIGTPVYDEEGNKKGVLLVNYLGKSLLSDYRQVMGEEAQRGWLINRNSYWLAGPSSDLEWGFMHKKPQARLAEIYPDAWGKMQEKDVGQFVTGDGLWTFSTIHPLREGHQTSEGAVEAFTPSLSEIERKDYFWKAVLLLPKQEIQAVKWQTGIQLGSATFILMLAFYYGCWRLACAWRAEAQKEEELRLLNDGLEKTVEERTAELKAEIKVRKKIETELRERSERFLSITNTSSAAIIITVDQTDRIVTWNKAACHAFGYDEKDAIGMPLVNIIPERYRKLHSRGLAHATLRGDLKSFSKTIEMVALRKNGNEFPVEISLGTWVQDGIRYFSAIMLEITERKEAENKLKYLATHDPLTHLPTRVLCIDYIKSAMAAADRHKKMMAVLFVDLDGFKAVNDTYGHDAGDELLVLVADRLEGSVRGMDTVSRLGGDEFVVILEDISGESDVEVVANKLIANISTPYDLEKGKGIKIGASIGVALYSDKNHSADDLIQLADQAMYDVKNDTKNGYCFYSKASA
jgi:diguanylate cyclase (GGDEF)-like protein/PAS domain S-box-containing protein